MAYLGMSKKPGRGWRWMVVGTSLLVVLVAVGAAYVWLTGWWAGRGNWRGETSPKSAVPAALQPLLAGSVAPDAQLTARAAVPYRVEPVVSDLRVPWSLVFTAPDRMLVTERPGQVRVVQDGQLLAEPLLRLPEVTSQSEDGLMGMALDPEYQRTKYVYLCLTYDAGADLKNKVVRFTDRGSKTSADPNFTTIIADIPAAVNHAGCRLTFGPDQKLYVTTGDATNRELAQDLSSLAGKILRLNADGTIPADNPFPGSPIYSYGHRNPQGLAWNQAGVALATEHGPSGFDGPGGGDEVNVIQPGGNYGWPLVSHGKTRTGTVPALLVFTPAVAPASGMFYTGTVFPQFQGAFLFGALRGQGLMVVTIADDTATAQKLPEVAVGRVRDVVQGPDGLIYFSTSNQDGRGQPQEGDDKIYRLVPQ